MGSAAGSDRTALAEDGASWPSADVALDDVENLLHAAVVRAVGPGDGGCAVEDRVDAPRREAGPERRHNARRDDDPQVPSFARETRTDRPDDEHHQRHACLARRADLSCVSRH